jgi:8-oxo-dGTP pyrophosphatase MutT (NUDIX family)
VQAAGGVVWRGNGRGVEVLVVHRPKYGDWTFPKGKLDPGETHEQAALREVEEETRLRCRLGVELAATSYDDRKGRPKQVRYWAMTVEAGDFQPTDEVDRVQWLRPEDAAGVLSYERDLEVLADFVARGVPAHPR